MAIYIVKMRVWNSSQTMWDSFQTSVFNVENLPFIIFGTLHARAGLCLRVHASWLRAQVDSYTRRPRVFLAFVDTQFYNLHLTNQ